MIKQALHALKRKIACIRNPIAFYRNEGAIIGSGCEITANTSFGSEPWLIEIGNNVKIVANVSLITHDGALWVPTHIEGGTIQMLLRKIRYISMVKSKYVITVLLGRGALFCQG